MSGSIKARSIRTLAHEEVHPLQLGSTKAQLFIECVEQSDAGLYTCVAETPTKRITTTTQLNVGQLSKMLGRIVEPLSVTIFCSWATLFAKYGL